MRKRNGKRLKALAREQIVFPACVPGQKSEYVFENDRAEKIAMIDVQRRQNKLAKLRKMDAEFQRRELEYLRAKCRAYAEIIARDA